METQDKALRRISELREQCSLEQSAKVSSDLLSSSCNPQIHLRGFYDPCHATFFYVRVQTNRQKIKNVCIQLLNNVQRNYLKYIRFDFLRPTSRKLFG